MRKKCFDLQCEIKKAIEKYDAKLIYYDYNRRFFGNTIVKILDRNNVEHEFNLDRDTIYIDDKTIVPFIYADPKFPEKRYKVFVGCIAFFVSKL